MTAETRPTPLEMLRKAHQYIAANTRYSAESVAKMHNMTPKETESLVKEWLNDNTLLQEIRYCIEDNS